MAMLFDYWEDSSTRYVDELIKPYDKSLHIQK